MTTLVALATKDALVMGCDSLGTASKRMVDPIDLAVRFFDPSNNWELKTDENGQPLLQNFEDVFNSAQNVPFNHMTHMEKLFSLEPLEMAVMHTGLTSIGDRTINSLMKEFKKKDQAFSDPRRRGNYTVNSVGRRLLSFVRSKYQAEYPDTNQTVKPEIELMIGGYDKREQTPSIFRLFIRDNRIEPVFVSGQFGITFGGQVQEIQRIVFGSDDINRVRILQRMEFLYGLYREKLKEHLAAKGVEEDLPGFDTFGDDLIFFHEWDLNQFAANWGDFSEQNAIECVTFFVDIMIQSQQYSNSMPTVGGDIHVGLVTKDRGYQPISREVYHHRGFETPKGGK